jgi:hypothetical protein
MGHAVAWVRANPPDESDAGWFNYAAEDEAVAAHTGR